MTKDELFNTASEQNNNKGAAGAASASAAAQARPQPAPAGPRPPAPKPPFGMPLMPVARNVQVTRPVVVPPTKKDGDSDKA